jgi:glycosyltransferase involved in cell wall biosynthesis
MPRKRILLITTIFPPQIGGPATFIDRLAHALAAAGQRVTVICVTRARDKLADVSRPFRVIRVGGRTQIETEIRSRIALVWQMLWHNVILVNGLEYPSWQAAVITRKTYFAKIVGDSLWETARNNGLTTLDIEEFQSVKPEDDYLKRLENWRSRFLFRARLVVTPSQYLQNLVLGWGVPAENTGIVPNGIPLDEYKNAQPFQRMNGALQVVFVGRLTNWKGVETLLLAAAQVDGISIHIVGDGPAFPLLIVLAKQLGLGGRMKFWGRLDPEALKSTLRDMHVLVLGSSYEGLSHTLIEAGAHGLPAIASDCGGNPDVIEDGINGLLIPYGDVSALAQALVRLRNSEEFRYRLACNAKANSARFNFENTLEQWMQILLS